MVEKIMTRQSQQFQWKMKKFKRTKNLFIKWYSKDNFLNFLYFPLATKNYVIYEKW